MKKTIIYGGAFNPPTIAHEVILNACADYANKINADLWVMLSGNRLDKQILPDREQRIRYANAMIQDLQSKNKVVDVITIELDRIKPVETFDTVKELAEEYPSRSFIWVFGDDSVRSMPNWKNGQWLLDNLEILVVKHTNKKVSKIAKNMTILKVRTPNINSTKVRSHLNSGESVDNLVGRFVKKLLDANKIPHR